MKCSILFACERPNDRVLKTGYALKKAGVHTAAIFRQCSDNQDYGRYFDYVRVEPDTNEIPKLVNRFPSDIVHLHSFAFDQTALEIIRESSKKILYDPKDVFPGLLDKLPSSEMRLRGQIHLLTKSAGLILRDAQAPFSARLMGYKLAKKRLLFPDYCWSSDFFPQKVQEYEELTSRTLKLVFIGNFWPERQPPHWTGAGQIHNFRELLRNGHTIDVYPASAHQGLDHSEYIELSEESEGRFMMRLPTSEYDLITNKLPKYDLAIFIAQDAYMNDSKIYWHPKLPRYGIGSRIFDFASAGLLTLVSYRQTACSPLVKMGLAVSLPKAPLSEALGTLPALLQSAKFGKERLKVMRNASIDSHINKLITFYRSV